MRFLVLGCNGMAGHMISLYLHERGHEVLGFDLTESKFVRSVAGDARNIDFLMRLIKDGKFDSVINCIGVLNQFAEQNKELAVFLNSYFPHFLVDVTKGMDTQIIHMSTDCVFSGKRGQYTEEDYRDGETFYDRSKALGEIDDEKNITLRNSIVGPDTNPKGIGLMNWFMSPHDEVLGFSKVMWTGQTTLQLAKTMEEAAKVKASGLVNSVPEQPISKFDLLCLFNKYLRHEKILIRSSDAQVIDKSLRRTRFSFSYLIPDYELMIAELATWMKEHKAMYPHYEL